MVVKTKGIVLKETPYSETSKILNILTENYGLIGVISKGSRNIKSKLRGISNKMIYAEFTISYKEKGLSTLIEGSIINPFKNIYTDIKKATYSFYIIDLISQVLEQNNHYDIFYLLVNALIKINDGLSLELISNIVELKLLKYLGVPLQLDECILCNSKDIYTIDINNGGTICHNCYQEGYVFDIKSIKLMNILMNIDLEKIEKLEITEPKIFSEIDNFIHEYYNSYTGIFLRDKKKMFVLE